MLNGLGRFLRRHPQLLVGFLTACTLLPAVALCQVRAEAFLKYSPLRWEPPYWRAFWWLQAGLAVTSTGIAWIAGCWLGRSGIPPRRVLGGLAWAALFLLLMIPPGVLLGKAVSRTVQTWFPPTLDEMPILLGPVQPWPAGDLMVSLATVIAGHLLGWALAEWTTRNMLRHGRWEHVEGCLATSPIKRP